MDVPQPIRRLENLSLRHHIVRNAIGWISLREEAQGINPWARHVSG
jgi:hypothetical protein